MGAIEITYHDDLILAVDPDVREWLGDRLPDHPIVAVRDASTVYACPGASPLRSGPDVESAPCGLLPCRIAERAAHFLVAEVDLPDFRSGQAHLLEPDERTGVGYAAYREHFEKSTRLAVSRTIHGAQPGGRMDDD